MGRKLGLDLSFSGIQTLPREPARKSTRRTSEADMLKCLNADSRTSFNDVTLTLRLGGFHIDGSRLLKGTGSIKSVINWVLYGMCTYIWMVYIINL